MSRGDRTAPHHQSIKKIDMPFQVETNAAEKVYDYLEYWGLHRKPFENNTDPDFFYESYDHIEALERLFYIIEEGNMNFGLLTGEIGCGKTITRSVLKERLSPIRYEVIDLENSNLTFNFILLELIQRMSLENFDFHLKDDELYYLLKEFKKLVDIKISQRKKNLVIILDEAQQLTNESIIELKNLTNITFNNQSYITIILMGQPELRSVVKNLPQIDQRVSLRYHLNPLSERDVAGYLSHRLKVSGHADGALFTEKAVQMLSQVTGGIPREMNRICQLSLDRSFSLCLESVNEDVVKSIVMDLQKQDGKIRG